jgi:hypothetical protein
MSETGAQRLEVSVHIGKQRDDHTGSGRLATIITRPRRAFRPSHRPITIEDLPDK